MKISAQVVLINEEGLILGVSRKDDHNDFGLIGGKMEPQDDNDPTNTAIRETLEETGLEIYNLRLVFAIHKDSFMGYTYLADYKGEINHNEPHVVKWVPMERLVMGSFGKYNKMVSDSLKDMGVKFIYDIPLDEIKEEVKKLVEQTDKSCIFIDLKNSCNWFSGNKELSVTLTHYDGEYIYGDFVPSNELKNGLLELSKKFGVPIRIPSDYLPK
jgi:ADP-ribose pyrophosphatase YjhB (NUDIX family)